MRATSLFTAINSEEDIVHAKAIIENTKEIKEGNPKLQEFRRAIRRLAGRRGGLPDIEDILDHLDDEFSLSEQDLILASMAIEIESELGDDG